MCLLPGADAHSRVYGRVAVYVDVICFRCDLFLYVCVSVCVCGCMWVILGPTVCVGVCVSVSQVGYYYCGCDLFL